MLCGLYLLWASLCMAGDLMRAPGPLIIPDMTSIIAFPGLVVVMISAEALGVSEITGGNWLLVHVPAALITAGLVYLVGAAAAAPLGAAFRGAGRSGLR